MNGNSIQMSVGPFNVVTTSDGGLPPEYYAERICERLLMVSETAPPELRAQAMAFREAMAGVVLGGVRGAILSNQTTIIAQLRKAGFEDAASLVFALRSN